MLLEGLTPEEGKALILSVGTHKGQRPLSPVEVGKLFRKAISNGATKQACASFVQLKGRDMVTRFLRLLDLTSLVQHSTGWWNKGPTISFTSAWMLSTLPPDKQEKACFEVMANQLRSKEVEQAIQLMKRSGRGFSECVAEVVRMRPTIEKVHVILGAVIDTTVKEWLSLQTQAQRDRVFSQLLTRLFPSVEKCFGRLGTDRFTIVTNDEGYNVIVPGENGSFEDVITDALTKEMRPL